MDRICRPALSVVLFALSVGCGSKHPEAAERSHGLTPDGHVQVRDESRAYISVEPAGQPSATVRHPLFARVTLDEHRLAVVGSPVAGRITAVWVATGDRVERGARLLAVHSADVVAARAAIAEARQTRTLAEQTALRAARLVRKGAGSIAEQQQADTALAQARSEERRAARTALALGLRHGDAEYVLRSPIAGRVVERPGSVGNAVSADQDEPLVTIADMSTVWVLADVHEHDIAYVHAGDATTLVVSSLAGRRYEGRIDHVSEVVDVATRTARARIVIENVDRALRPGMFVDVEVRSPNRAISVVPVSAVLAQRDEYYVFVRSAEDTYERRAVRIGVREDDHVGVLEGVSPGEPIVTRGAILLDAEANTVL